MRKAIFGLDGCLYIGYTNGDLFGKWAIPYFEVDEAFAIIQKYNENCKNPISYAEGSDSFWQSDTETKQINAWKGRNCETLDGIKHLYGVGAYLWEWVEESQTLLAARIAEFIWDGESNLFALKTRVEQKLEDVDTLKKAIIILRSNESKEIKCAKLGGF